MRLIFISDLHLSSDTEENNQLFYELLNKWQVDIDALYILGDFFDAWLGDDDSNLFIEQMKLHLREFTKKKPIYYIRGNHDFAVGRRFERQTGVKILKDCSVIEVANNRILLTHGDVFCSLDVGYQRLKKIIQNPILLWILKLLPLNLRVKIKSLLENKSSTNTNKKPKATYHVVDSTVAEIAHKKLAKIVIHGHTHNPGKYLINVPVGTKSVSNNIGGEILRVEIPDWSDRRAGGYVLVEDSSISLFLVS